MRTEEEIRKRLKFTEFIIDDYHRELQDFKYWNLFVDQYWLLKWVLGETGSHSSETSTKEVTG